MFTVLLLVIAGILLVIFQFPDRNLHVITCDVGQGDSILITYNSTQILTDGGPGKSVLTCLGKYMPFYDREIELVISTHPDSDHSTGLVSVLQDYTVDEILINPVDPGTQVYKALVSEVGGRGLRVINPISGMKVGLGLIYLDIISPSQQLLDKLSVKEEASKLVKYEIGSGTNLYSIVYKLSFKNFSAMFTGDMPPEVSDELSKLSGADGLDYIKIPHHGSSNGLTENFLKAFDPEVAVISVGKNPWGFPKSDILDMLAKYDVRIYRTDLMGDVELITDGEKYWIR
ncbi:MAG: internalization-like protein competence protein ComEC/Rec2, competence protein ComEC protein [Microgenomates group bacterium GW2011_GWC1_41_20]|uniref:Putative hydrolase n=5 Tax=Candidatus Woeseibacteriota TaxID=1752722 RepID=A0A0G0UZN8_9BACT|nr:MAG: putative hydrolase [Candidatus Woesebacteria bacterium GW2011_GWB1_40_12]KKR55777.1 MAG: putative hydrolase [Candidatus Woesebacteria bacterium GW2011_GWF1_40_24]KKR90090.1 MAG: putative hydrolase [Candidatus Woesebacteria bacterium GW2011_GWD1_41_12]KKS00324.1 MAG: internalization-like protein competence protein ComEC/Rec2, competence protein ComEC protein [Microgenomates group bacterium GW2011_GWC1_41_20]KKS05513.1 MAG: putative hydrolase [Candidatus Woesebacteria bacterium GW2011_GWE